MDHLVGAFNQKKALEEAFSVIVITDGSFAALLATAPRLPTNTLNEPNPTPPESQVSSTFYRKQPSKH